MTTDLNTGPYAGSIHSHTLASELLPGGVSSNFRFHSEPVPLSFARAQGAHLYDVDGHRYIDYMLGMGPAILGHAPAGPVAAVAATLREGQLFAGQHARELALAERVCAVVPSAERVRFGLSGSEMVQLALRLARAATGRRLVVKFEGHYHGWFDTIFYSTSPPVDGAPRAVGEPVRAHPQSEGQSPSAAEDVVVLPWNDLAEVEAFLAVHGDDTALLLMEPILCNTAVVPPAPGYLEGVRALCDRHGVVLAFDEVITGFRVGLGGAQERLGVLPDLTVLAKAMGGGFPVAALAGRADLFELVGNGRVMHGGTYNTNLVSTAGAIGVIDALRAAAPGVYEEMAAHGERVIDGLRERAAAHGSDLHVQGLGVVFNTCFGVAGEVTSYRDFTAANPAKLRAFLRALQDRGVRVTARGTWFMSAAHSDADVDATLAAADGALAELEGTIA